MLTKKDLYIIIFGSDTKLGKLFDIVLIWAIALSVFVVILDSIPVINQKYEKEFYLLEWFFTIIFTIEYILRIFISPHFLKYLRSFWGVIDLLAILPTYLSFFFYGYQYLLVIRILRLLRVFRVLKLFRFNDEALSLIRALKASLHKIAIFFSAVLTIVILLGTIMYVIEGGENGFSSIPQSIYWAVITITTVGYGDIVPQTTLGKFISAFAMIIGYAIIAVPTGIITVEMAGTKKNEKKYERCKDCSKLIEVNSNYCNNCGKKVMEKNN